MTEKIKTLFFIQKTNHLILAAINYLPNETSSLLRILVKKRKKNPNGFIFTIACEIILLSFLMNILNSKYFQPSNKINHYNRSSVRYFFMLYEFVPLFFAKVWVSITPYHYAICGPLFNLMKTHATLEQSCFIQFLYFYIYKLIAFETR